MSVAAAASTAIATRIRRSHWCRLNETGSTRAQRSRTHQPLKHRCTAIAELRRRSYAAYAFLMWRPWFRIGAIAMR